MKCSPGLFAFMLAAALGCAGLSCRQSQAPAPSPHTSSTSPTNQRIFQVKGVIHEVTPEKKRVKIAHEEIPGYMEAMTMQFDVKVAKELDGLQPGDAVSFRMIVTEDDGWIEQIMKTGSTNLPPAPETFRRVREVEPLAVGDKMPDYSFTNEAGGITKLSDFKGQGLAFTFIFTRCPFPTFCPRLSGLMAEAHDKLKSMPDAPTNWHMLSITIDPAYDTPKVLAFYAKRYKADPARWNFLTGEMIDIDAITEQFGLEFYRPDPNVPANISHKIRTVVVDAAGHIQWITNDNEWKPDVLVEQIILAARRPPNDQVQRPAPETPRGRSP